jgi:hypothetical protein
MRRHQTSASSNVLQSSIAINQKKNNRVIDNAMKIMNNALIERLRDREKELSDLKAINAELLEQIKKFKKEEKEDVINVEGSV